MVNRTQIGLSFSALGCLKLVVVVLDTAFSTFVFKLIN